MHKVSTKIRTLICSITWSILSLTSVTYAAPHKLLGENGAFGWSASQTVIHSACAVDGGERLLLSWSACRASDHIREITYQVMDRQGRPAFDPPRVISDPANPPSGGAGKADAAGNYYLAWYSISPNDSTTAIIHCQKFGPDASVLWGDPAPVVDEINGVDAGLLQRQMTVTASMAIVPDDVGGCYIILPFGMVSVSSEGRRRDWNWQTVSWAADGRNPRSAISDCAGGVWVVVYDREGDERGYRTNHYNADGTRLFDDDWATLPLGGMPAGSWITYQLTGIPGGLVTGYSSGNVHGLCVLDTLGNLIDDAHLHPLPNWWTGVVTRTPNGLLLSINDVSNDDEDLIIANAFDPVHNDFPWGENGRVFWTYQSDVYPHPALVCQVNENDAVAAVSYHENYDYYSAEKVDIFEFDLERGEMVGQPVTISTCGPPKYWGGSADGGFWLGGVTSDAFSTEPSYLNYFNAQRQAAVAGTMNIGNLSRLQGTLVHANTNQAGNYQFWLQDGNRMLIQELTRGGNIVGDPNGHEVQNLGDLRTTSLPSVLAGTNLIRAWVIPDSGMLYCASFDGEGRLVWSQMVALPLTSRKELKMALTEDSTKIVLSTIDYPEDDSRCISVHLLDVADGAQLWSANLSRIDPERPLPPTVHWTIACSGEGIYVAYWKPDIGTLGIERLDLNGELSWANPITMQGRIPSFTEADAIVSDGNGGVWAWFNQDNPIGDGVVDYRIRRVTSEGGLTDSLSIFNASSINYNRMIRNNGLIWFLPSGREYTEAGGVIPIQALRDTVLVYDPPGLVIQPAARTSYGYFDAKPCQNGDLFLYYSDYYRPGFFQKRTMITILDTTGMFRDGWDSSGVPMFNMIDENASLALMDGNLLAGKSYGQFQVISNSDDASVSPASSTLPREIKLTLFPNPFNSTTMISYNLPAVGWTEVDVVDIEGRRVSELARGRVSAGAHSVVWNAEGVPAGVYFVRLRVNLETHARKVVLLR